MIAVNRIGVAKRLSLRSESGRTRILTDPTALKHTKAWKNVLRRDPCAYCGGLGGTIDHITPMALGGAKDSIRNWTGACLECNLKRGPRGLIYFLTDTEDPTPGERTDAIKKLRRSRKHDIGPEIRRALEGVADKAERRRIAGGIMRRHRAGYRERKLGMETAAGGHAPQAGRPRTRVERRPDDDAAPTEHTVRKPERPVERGEKHRSRL